MKKIILLALTAMFVGCVDNNYQNPDYYKGCIIDTKGSPFPHTGYYLMLKLTPELRDSIGKDYRWIQVTLKEYQNRHVGDTIK